MEIGDRVFLAIFSGGLALHFGILSLSAFGWEAPSKMVSSIHQKPQGRVILAAMTVAFFLVSLRFFIFTFKGKYGSKTVVLKGPMGEVRVNLGAIENLVKRVCRQVPGVNDIKASVSNKDNAVTVFLRCQVAPDVSIPELTRDLHKTVQAYVSSVVGVEVKEIEMVVENITADGKKSRSSSS